MFLSSVSYCKVYIAHMYIILAISCYCNEYVVEYVCNLQELLLSCGCNSPAYCPVCVPLTLMKLKLL